MENQFDDKPEEKATEIGNDRPLEKNESEISSHVEAGTVETESKEQDTISDSPIERPYQRWQRKQEEQSQSGQQNGSYEYSRYQSGQPNDQYQQSQYQQNSYQDNQNSGYYQNYQNQNYQGSGYREQGEERPMTMGDWLLVLIAGAIPCVGQILYIVWAFSSTGNVNRRNYCRAALVLMLAVFVIYLIFGTIFAVGFTSALN
mgnify:CR=1 FL=1